MRHAFFYPAILVAAVLVATLSAPAPAAAFDACLGAKAADCLNAIATYLDPRDHARAEASIERYLAGDIAGKRKAKGMLSVPYYSKYADPLDPPQLLTIDYAPSLRITEIHVYLRRGATAAETEEEYRATHMYETAIFALGTREDCRELANAHDFYLFFHTKVRPKLRAQPTEHIKGMARPSTDLFAETGWVGLCGHQMNFLVSSQEWGALQADMGHRYGAHSASLAFR
jgi:hypothetical protein